MSSSSYGRLGRDAQGNAQCHVCGKFYRALGVHVVKAHGFGSAKDYRKEFGLRLSIGLDAPDVKDKRRKTYDANEGMWHDGNPEIRSVRSQRVVSAEENLLYRERRTSYIKNANGKPLNSILTPSMIDEIMRRVEAGERQVQIAEDLGVAIPTVNHVVTGRSWSELGKMKPEPRGVRNRGEKNARALLNENQVREIRKLRDEGSSYAALSRVFGVNRRTLAFVCSRKTWAHVA